MDVHPIETDTVTINARQRQAGNTGGGRCVMCGEPSVLSTCDTCEETRWGLEAGTLARGAHLIPFVRPEDTDDEALETAA